MRASYLFLAIAAFFCEVYGTPHKLEGKPLEYRKVFHWLIGKNDNPSGIYSMSLTKGKEIKTFTKGAIPSYHLQISGLPKGKRFQIANRNAFGTVVTVFEGTYLEDGTIFTEDKVVTCESIVIGGFERGEPSEFLLIDPAAQTTDSVFYLPYPANSVSSDGIVVNRLIISHCPTAYLFGIENLIPGEEIFLRSTSGTKRVVSTLQAPVSGMVSSLTFPETGEPSGEAVFEIERGGRILRIAYPWVAEFSKINLPFPPVILTIDRPPTDQEEEAIIDHYWKYFLFDEFDAWKRMEM